MSNTPWFRFYSETLSDRKLARVCRVSGQPKAVVIGVWAVLLSLANESPQRGRLLISDDLELTTEEIRDETGLDAEVFDVIITALTQFGLIIKGDCWEICNWNKRQFSSDSSAERVRRHRQNKAKKPQNTDETGGNRSETLQERYSNALDTDTDTDTDTEVGTASAPPPDDPPTDLPTDFFENPPEHMTPAQLAAVAAEQQGPAPDSPYGAIEAYCKERIGDPNNLATYGKDWKEPINAMLAMTKGDVEMTIRLIDAALDEARKPKASDGEPYHIYRPYGLMPFFRTQLENHRAATSAVTPETIWQKTLTFLNANKPPDEPRLLAAVKSVGWPALMAADEYSTPRLKSQLFNAYRSAPV